MGYANKTDKYKLESPTVGEQMDTQSEQRNMQIIENQIYGGIRMHSGGHGIIRLGVFTFDNSAGTGNYIASLGESKAQAKPVIEAFIAQEYVFTVDGISWTGLSNSTTYYLGVRLVENSTNSSLQYKEVTSWINTTGSVPSDGLLLAVLTVDGSGNATFDTEATDVITIPVLGNHIGDSQNPHGTKLFQDNLVVSGLNVLGTLQYNTIQVDNFVISGNNSTISGNLTIRGDLTVSGNIVVSGILQYNTFNVQNLNVPGSLTVGNLTVASGMNIYSTSRFRRNILLNSGVSIDGFDPSEAVDLLNGSNADHLHTHNFGSVVPVKTLHLSPEYMNTVLSGEYIQHSLSGVFAAKRAYSGNYYEFHARTSGAAIVSTRINLPSDFHRLEKIEIRNVCKKEAIISGSNLRIEVYDKDAVLIANQQYANLSVTLNAVTTSGGQLVANNPMTVVSRLWSISGVPTSLGDMSIYYQPRGGEEVCYTWTETASGNTVLNATPLGFNGVRYNPVDMKVQKVILSQSLALSGTSVVGFKLNALANPTPEGVSTIFVPRKNLISFGTVGASYQSDVITLPVNLLISGNTFVQCCVDQVASGSKDLTFQMIGYRV